MDLRIAILKEHSKQNTLMIAGYIGDDEKKFAHLMELFFGEDYKITQRATWILSYVAEAYPHQVIPYLDDMAEVLKDEKRHPAVRRNVLKIFGEIVEIPEHLYGMLATLCFDFIADMDQPVAIKVFSMEVIYKITIKEPDLADELIILIEDLMPHHTAGFKSRGKKILKKLKTLQKKMGEN